MSDYDYNEDYQYEEEEAMEEENIETKVEMEYFEVEDLIRKAMWQQAIEELEKLYTLSEENNLKSWKIKILNQLLQIYCKNFQVDCIKTTIHRIAELNKQEKYTENSVRSIVTIMRNSDYQKIRTQLLNFIEQLESALKLKSYLLLLQKAIEEKDQQDSAHYFGLVNNLIEEQESISSTILVEYYSLEIKFSKLTGADISDKIHEMQLRIPSLEAEAYMSEGHISVLKLAIAEIMFEYGNFENSSLYVAEAFLEKAKYGNSAQLKQFLKINTLLSLLIQNVELRKNDKYSTLYHDVSIPFKNEKDVQALISLVDSYEKHDLEGFKKNYQNINFKPECEKYHSIYDKLLFNLKKEKLIAILKSYKTIKFSYISKRLSLSEQEVEKMVFELIIDQKIRGRINDVSQANKYLEILPPRNEYLEIQAENIRELSKRFINT